MALRKLGPYRIERLLGRGGMGAVFAAVNEETGVAAAIKVLAPAYAEDDRFRRRFESEIETLKQLKHPNIVELFGYGEHEGELFFAMELVDGRSLQEELRSGRVFSWQEVVHIGVDVCAALRHAHDRGVVHRDLKPANLLIDKQGAIKLTDFGIAKLFGAAQFTADGSVIGTADYMSPEQALGRPVTFRSDLYSLGSVLYTLLARRPPFADVALHQVVHKLCNEPPPPLRKLAIGAPPELVDLIEQLLAKDPADRVATAHALSNRLRAAEFVAVAREDEEKQRETDRGGPADEGFTSPSGIATPSSKGPGAHSRSDDPLDDASEFLTPLDSPPGDQTLLHDTHGGKPTRYSGDFSSDPSHEHHELRLAPEGPETPSGRPPGASGSHPARGQPTSVWRNYPTVGPNAEAGGESRSRTESRFTTVEEDLRRRAERDRQEQEGPPLWVKAVVGAGGVIVAAAALIAGGYIVMRPSTSDSLYQRILAAANSEEPRALLSVADEMDEFENRFPNDPRAAEVAEFQQDLELYKLQRRFDLRTRRLHRATEDSPLESAYVQAMEKAKTDPEAAIRQLRALTDLFSGSPPQSAAARQIAELAKLQLARMEKSQQALRSQHLALIRERLAAADRVAEKDPNQARAIWQGLVSLYRDKDWAQPVLAQAERRLAEASP